MSIAEMHVWFRQYAQQMGMQNVRAILPEQIDLLINTSITDTVNQIITQNIGVTNDRIITDNSKIGQINALRSLYKVKLVSTAINPSWIGPEPGKPFSIGDESYIRKIYAKLSDFNDSSDVYYIIVAKTHSGEQIITAEKCTKETYDANPNKIVLGKNETVNDYTESQYAGYCIKHEATEKLFEYLYLVDLAINYSKPNTKTNYFPVRLIDDSYLADTLNDFVLRPRLRSPIAVLYDNQLDLYIDILEGDAANKHLPQSLEPYELRVSYIAKPNKVAYQSDLEGKDEDCDLPDYMHVDILKHAVDLYNTAINGGLYAAQQQQQAQNREMSRNQARPDNEGYQS